MRYASGLAAVIYIFFAASCFRLIWAYDGEDWGLAIGEGLFTLLGGIGLVWTTFARRYRAAVAIAATVPLVGWFLATPYNSGPPFLVASLLVPAVAATAWAVTLRA